MKQQYQYNQVIQVMEQLGGYATLGMLNQKVDCNGWRTRTPYATIRRIVQEQKEFFRIRPGLWALETYRKKLGHLLDKKQSSKKQEERNHSYYQGLLLDTGNLRGFQTFIPNQDKNQSFLKTTLGALRSRDTIPQFSYKKILDRVCRIDVIWFKDRDEPNGIYMPYAVFEVEHSTDFTGSLSRYLMLQDFNVKLYVVSSHVKEQEFKNKLSRVEYGPISRRVKFVDYELVGKWYEGAAQTQTMP